ncbi:CaiB/BaiF CoA transferase family protein [Marivita hallyeonensis]|uniref:Crotonobetainyl-CoA:carnitine CoA-transferase CaiB n=1 Tax=Marivita hallyeonensis TaxID=996342 RepID=A0A1M5SAZ1_9RHOB|nr:CaiB/BaiF CoA-transferase family protein [Marivita hallyeonensis]SHH35666.1 Crotonobetainyl-CoA:carnitine CoA-transferase CaiB [Marivita hallyeonensis]
MQDLEGITVVALEQAVAAPYASGRLADAGARVIKIERSEGDFARGYDALVNGESAYFVWLNRGKESIRLDVKKPEDHALLDRMIASADVFIQNLAPGAAARLGFGADALLARFPRLIHCSISGYGEDGPYRDQKAYDLLIQAESGLCAINGTEHGAARVGVSVCDIAAGMTAFQAILQGLFARERSGQGRAIDVSLFHAMADWMNVPYLQTRYGGKPPARVGLKHPTIAPYGAYACADGKAVLISIQNEREWQRLCTDVLEDEGLAVDSRFITNSLRVANRPALEERVAAVFSRFTREAMIERLQTARIAFGRLSDLDDLLAHPQNRLISVTTSAGEIEMLAPGAVVRGQVTKYRAVPDLGDHDVPLRAEFGATARARKATA